MALILDTSAVSAILVGDPDIRENIQPHVSLAIPVIVVGEYHYGLKRSVRADAIETAFRRLLSSVDILPVDLNTAMIYASVRESLRSGGTPIPENDVWIAALAVQTGYSILSRDTHFDHVGEVTRVGW